MIPFHHFRFADKCLQAIGGAVAWRLDGEEVP